MVHGQTLLEYFQLTSNFNAKASQLQFPVTDLYFRSLTMAFAFVQILSSPCVFVYIYIYTCKALVKLCT